jgi:peptidoglycan/LPS O-acetylase OafA/YrhL
MTTTASTSASVPAPAAPRERSFAERSSGRVRGIDGLRAIAVIAVILFHLSPGAVVGGFLGVDIFFVISGFLITGLLLRERDRGRIHFGRFWLRRARRLLPALVLMLLVCASAALVIGGDVLVGVRGQLFGAGTFSYNWLDIRRGSSYFDDSIPELFRNLWSLAVEEQFYVVWPLVLALLVFVKSTRFRVGFAVTGAVASLVAMIVIFQPGADSTRVYYGTDTHSFGLAIGAALALLIHARPATTWTATTQRSVAISGTLAIPALMALAYYLPADADIVFHGGLALVAMLTVLAIAACTMPNAVLGRVLDIAPLRWVGQRSYGLYLWHWPVFILIAAAFPVFTLDANGLWILGGISVTVTLVAATLSYRYIETPIRRDGFIRPIAVWWRAVALTRRPALRRAVASVTVLALVGLTITTIVTAPRQGSVETGIEAGRAAIENAPVATTDDPAQPAVTTLPLVPHQLPTGDQITAIGDSVMLAAATSLQDAYPGIDIHAVVSRQLKKGPAVMRSIIRKGELRPVVIVALGTNGPIKEGYLDTIRDLAGPDALMVLVTVQAPRDWTTSVNTILSRFATTHRNVELADWRGVIRQGLDLLYPDKIHPEGRAGGEVYAAAVTAALQRLVDLPPPVDMNMFRRTPQP